MSDEPAKLFNGNSDPTLSNAGVMAGGEGPSFRNPVPSTSFSNNIGPPALPPRPDYMQPSYGMNAGYSYGGMGGSYGIGGYGGYGYNGFGGGYGMGMGMGMGMGGMNSYGAFNRYGPMDLESR